MYHCFQSITPVPEIGRSLCSDTCPTTSGQDATVKVEVGLEAEVGEGPEPISFPEIKAENEVSCVSVFSLLYISQLLYAHKSVAFFNVPVCITIFHIIECLLIMFLHVIGWLHYCGTLPFECISVCVYLYPLIQ